MELENREMFKLATNLKASLSASTSRVVVIVPVEEDGSAAKVAVQLASTLAKTSETPVGLIDANFAAPTISSHTTKVSSLETALSSPQSYSQMVQSSHAEGNFLALAPAASSASSAASTRENAKAPGLLKPLRQLLESQIGGVVVVLAPSARDLLFFSELASVVSGAVVVIEANKTRKQLAKTTVRELASLGLPVLGAVLTGRTYPIPDFLYDRL